METRCPACGKAPVKADECPRCGCDLTLPAAVAAAAERECREALRRLARGHARAASEHARRSWRLHHTLDAARALFLAAMARDDRGEARRWYRAVHALRPKEDLPSSVGCAGKE